MKTENTIQKLLPFLFSLIIVNLVLRIIETYSLLQNPFLGNGLISFELLGFIDDFIPVTVLLLVSFAILRPASKKAVKIATPFILFIYICYALVSLALQSYFTMLLYPVDRLIFNMPFSDVIETALSSTEKMAFEAVKYCFIACCIPVSYFISKKYFTKQFLIWLCLGLGIIATGVRISGLRESSISSKVHYYASQNKSLLLTAYNDELDNRRIKDLSLEKAYEIYQNVHNQKDFASADYPFLYKEDYKKNVLGEYFDSLPAKPNVMIIMVEALSRSYCGPGASLGSCTPFIDSLSSQSLFWEQCLSTSERTFEVIPSVLGSLPYGRQGFTVDGNLPEHLSLISLLNHNGYYTSFFHACDFKLYSDNWWSFFMNQNIDTIIDKACFPELEGFPCKWGMADESLFSHAFKTMQETKQSPRLDMFLTYSTHEPYTIPQQEKYKQEFISFVNSKQAFTEQQKNILTENAKRFSTVFYFDKQLKRFFDLQKSSGAYDNTIYIITGDHSLSNLSPHNTIKQYNVPLIIHSPFLKKGKYFKGTCSHLDIVPTLLALLKNKCAIQLPEYAHWLGKQLDTAAAEKQTYVLPMLSASKICKDYLSGDYYISGSKLYRCHELNTEVYANQHVYDSLLEHLLAFKTLNKHACAQNRLLPDSLARQYSSKTISLKDTSFHVFQNTAKTEEYTNLASIKTDNKYTNFKIRINLEAKFNTTEQYQLPRLVIAADDVIAKKNLSYQIDLFKRTDWDKLESGKWQEITLSQRTNILNSQFDSVSVSSFIWNPNKLPVEYRNISIHFEAEE